MRTKVDASQPAPTQPIHGTDVFHAGEHDIHTRLGLRDRIEAFGRRVIRPFMPDEHREFFSRLPFVVIGAADAADRTWASLLAGAPGFISSPDERTLHVASAFTAGDPLLEAGKPGADVALLGIELHTRRRNRMNASVISSGGDVLALRVVQSFGNCPKYIHPRQFERVEYDAHAPLARVSAQLDEVTARLINGADTFFIASHSGASAPAPAKGADVSHRGGAPGFVRVDARNRLTWPDYVGNNLFNTLGNLVLNPRAGLLFIDFEKTDLLHLSGRAEILWESADLKNFPGAQRLVRFHIDRVVHRPSTLIFA